MPESISETARKTHINAPDLTKKRDEECKQYSAPTPEPECRTLLSGEKVCGPRNPVYIPDYCYQDVSLDAYFANQIWNYSNDFITRNLYVGNWLVTVSNSQLRTHDIDANFADTGKLTW
jgi:hypothetical protein